MEEYTIFEVIILTGSLGFFNALNNLIIFKKKWKYSIIVGVISAILFFLLILLFHYTNVLKIINI